MTLSRIFLNLASLMPNSSIFALLIAILIAGVLIFLAIQFSGRRGHTFDVEDYQCRWLAIENTLNKDNPLSFNAAVVEADKLLDRALHEMGVPGKNMGERLKKSGSKFSELNSVWYVHKLRNQIAHEPGFSLDYQRSRRALTVFRQALKDLGAI